MQTVTIAINNRNAMQTLHELEEKKMIAIIGNNELDLPVFTGKQFSLVEFRNWVNNAEQSPSISIDEAKEIWKTKRSRLQKNIA
jgi:hypothetical protein